MNKMVTVLMSAYNHEKFVRDAIVSVLEQSYEGIYFMVADDASGDRTREIILEYEDKIDEIHLFDENSGASQMPAMLPFVTTEYTAIINSDDYWEKTKLAKQVAYMQEHPECAACFTWAEMVDDEGKVLEDEVFCQKNRSKEEWMRLFWLRANCLAHPSILIRTEIYKKLMTDENICVYRQLPDFYMWLNLIQEHEIHILQEKLITFRVHNLGTVDNVSAATVKNQLRDGMEQSIIWYRLMKKMNKDYFIKAFGDIRIAKDAVTEEEIQCEKFFILGASPVKGIAQAALYYYLDVMKDTKVYQIMKEKYGFSNKMFYEWQFQVGILQEHLKAVDLCKKAAVQLMIEKQNV